jgi:regulator of replication initiation timing
MGDRTCRTASSAGPGHTESVSADGTPIRQVLVEAQHENEALVLNLARLARAIRELATDLATTRRDCRDKEQRIDALQAENARLLAAAPAVMRRDDPDTEVPHVGDEVRRLAARRSPHEHALERMSSAVLVLRRGNLALKKENASLRLELARLREQKTGRDRAASAEALSKRGRRQ